MTEKVFDTILVTGGAGFIGSNLCEELLPISKKVIIIDDLSNSLQENLLTLKAHPNFKFYKANIIKIKELEKIFEKNAIEMIFHHAATSSVVFSFEDPLYTNTINVNGTITLLTLAQKYHINKFIFASSSSVYGNVSKLPIPETAKTNPLSPYASSKVATEYYANIYSINNRVNVIGLRYFNVFGPKQNPNSIYSGVISIFIKKALADEDLTIYGKGVQIRDFVYVGDVCQANIKSALHDGINRENINIGTGQGCSILNLAKKIIEMTNSKSEIVFKEPRKGDIENSIADISKAKKLINYSPQFSLEDGLQKTITYIKNNQEKI